MAYWRIALRHFPLPLLMALAALVAMYGGWISLIEALVVLFVAFALGGYLWRRFWRLHAQSTSQISRP